MPYGTIKIDTVTFTDNGVDKSVTVSGLVQNPTFSGSVTVTGTVSGATVRGATVSGATVTGTTANFASGVFTTQISGAVHVAPAGTVGAPSIQVGTGATVAPGIYGAGTDLLGISTGGASRLIVDSVGQIRIIAAGSAAAPSLILGNDLTTGLYSPGAGQVAISTNGSARLYVASDGKVGVGTNSPGSALQVNGSGGIRVNEDGAGTKLLQLRSDYSSLGPAINVFSNDPLLFLTNNTERLRITSAGLVGIGTSSPGTKLEVSNTGTYGVIYQPSLYINNSSSGGTVSNTTGLGAIGWRIDGLYDVANIEAVREVPSSGTYSALVFRTNPTNAATGAGTERMRIDSSGRVGIGTSQPTAALLQVGTGNVGATTTKVVINTNDSANTFALGLSNWTGAATSNGPRIFFDNSARGTWALGAGNGVHSFVIRDDGATADRLTIDGNGYVGIGTSGPSKYEHGGTLSLVELKNTNNAVNAQTQFICTSAYAGAGASAIGGFSAVLSDISVTNKLSGYVSFTTEAAHTSASPKVALVFATRDGVAVGTEKMRLDSAGRLGISTTGPAETLHLGSPSNQQIRIDGAGSPIYLGNCGNIAQLAINRRSTDGTIINTGLSAAYLNIDTNGAGSYFSFSTASAVNTQPTERLRIDGTGNLLVGTSVAAPSLGTGGISLGSTTGRKLDLYYSGNTHAGLGVDLGGGPYELSVYGPAGNANQGTIRFGFITEANPGVWTEQMRLNANGGVYCTGKTTDAIGTVGVGFSGTSLGNGTFTTSGIPSLTVNRKNSDGTLVEFYQDEILEGTISVSGSTVSYNGAHLSRWSQLPSGQEHTEILRGTVLSNIDEMCEWGEEGNEQLNRMKVSDVDGDKNVSGVFQDWDNDDDTYENDFYCAMTGDFIIRIAGDVTVERGDLLMSAGDGTAKPQDDDIIRSKTIAKVTSTNVSCTYEDGSYCVPCVLMAC
jgi:hypothetical protein